MGLAGLAAHGPLQADFLRDHFVRILQARIGGGHTVAIGSLAIQLTNAGLQTHLKGVTIQDRASQKVVLTAPAVSVGLETWPLAAFQLSPRTVIMDRLDLSAEIAADGRFNVTAAGLNDAAGPAEPAPAPQPDKAADSGAADPWLNFVTEVDRFLDAGGGAGRLGALEITNGSLMVRHLATGNLLHWQNLRLASQPILNGQRIDLTAEGPRGVSSLRAVSSRRDGQPAVHDISFSDLSIGDAASLAGLAVLPPDRDAPVSGEIRLSRDAGLGEILVSGRLNGGAVKLLPASAGAPALVADESSVSFAWSSGQPGLRITEAALHSGETVFKAAGAVTEQAGSPGVFSIELDARATLLAPLSAQDDLPALDHASVKLTLMPQQSLLRVDAVTVKAAGGAAVLSGALDWSEVAPKFRFAIDAERLPARAALLLWPSVIAPAIHATLVRRLSAGQLEFVSGKGEFSAADVQAALSGRPLPPEAFSFNYAVSRASFLAVDGLPPVSQLSAKGASSGRGTRIDFERGQLELTGGRRLQLSDGNFSLTESARKPQQAQVEARVQGSAEALAEALARPALKALLDAPLDPRNVKGQADLKVSAAFPLTPGLRPQEITASISGQITNLSIEKFFAGERLESGTLTFASERGGFTAKGDGRLSGLPVSLTLKQAPGAKTEAVAQFTLDDQARARRGLGFSNTVKGPVGVTVTASPPRGGAVVEASVALDLTRASIDGLLPGWSKPAGRAAKAAFDLTQKGDRALIEDLTFESGAVLIKGRAELAADQSLLSAKFGSLRLSPGDSAQADIEKTSGGYRVTLRADALDIKPLIKGQGPSRGIASGDIEFDLRAARLLGFNGEAISSAEAKYASRDGAIRAFSLAGQLGAARITGQHSGEGGVFIQGGDAGAALRFMDVYSRMTGGAMQMQMTMRAGSQTGRLTVRDFSLRNEPALRRLLGASQTRPDSGTAADATGSIDQRNASGDARFVKLQTDFTRDAAKLVLRDASMWNQQIGGSMSGELDYANDRANLSGTFVPAYALNNAFAQVPLLGPVLGGGKHEGLFGITFTITGRVSAPVLNVNPLSAVTPGFLRRIFSLTAEGAAPAGRLPAPAAVESPR